MRGAWLLYCLAGVARALRPEGARASPRRRRAHEAFTFEETPRMFKEGPRLRSDSWFRNLASLPRSKVLKRTASHLTFTSGWTILCVLVDYAQPGTLPNLDSTPLQVVGTAISLLLAFRTSQSYDRYWEGRGIWMETWSCCRSLKRAVVAGLWDAPGVSATARGTLDADASAIAVALIATFPLALIHHLRDQFGDEAIRVKVSDHFEAAALAANGGEKMPPATKAVADAWLVDVASRQENVPLAMTEALSLLAHDAGRAAWAGSAATAEYPISKFESNLDRLVIAISAAERLVMTPVPPSYTRHTSRLLSLWSLALPLCFTDIEEPLLVLPSVLLICWALYTLEEIGKIIEEPFGTDEDDMDVDLPLEKYAALIASDVLALPSEKARAALSWAKS